VDQVKDELQLLDPAEIVQEVAVRVPVGIAFSTKLAVTVQLLVIAPVV
jgi:hypothetical protein